MPKPLPEETRQGIIKDLLEGRLDLEEIAAKHSVSKGQVSKIAKKQGLSRKGKKRNGLQSKFPSEKPIPDALLKLETFGPEERLNLIDAALTQLKAILPKTNYSKGMNEWTASVERLFEQRRSEEPPQSGSEQEMLDKIVNALDQHAVSVSPKASTSLPGLPKDAANTDVRLGEERQD